MLNITDINKAAIFHQQLNEPQQAITGYQVQSFLLQIF